MRSHFFLSQVKLTWLICTHGFRFQWSKSKQKLCIFLFSFELFTAAFLEQQLVEFLFIFFFHRDCHCVHLIAPSESSQLGDYAHCHVSWLVWKIRSINVIDVSFSVCAPAVHTRLLVNGQLDGIVCGLMYSWNADKCGIILHFIIITKL